MHIHALSPYLLSDLQVMLFSSCLSNRINLSPAIQGNFIGLMIYLKEMVLRKIVQSHTHRLTFNFLSSFNNKIPAVLSINQNHSKNLNLEYLHDRGQNKQVLGAVWLPEILESPQVRDHFIMENAIPRGHFSMNSLKVAPGSEFLILTPAPWELWSHKYLHRWQLSINPKYKKLKIPRKGKHLAKALYTVFRVIFTTYWILQCHVGWIWPFCVCA